MKPQISLIPFEVGGHRTILGRSRCGKTHAVKISLAKSNRAVLFFNTQHEDMPKGFIKATGENNWEQIYNALRAGKKINFLPSTIPSVRKAQLAYLIDKLFDGHVWKVIVVVDEVHLFESDKEAKEQLERLATTGLRFGLNGVWISQRGAKVNNTLMTQSEDYIFFDSNLEGPYYKSYGIPFEEIQEKFHGLEEIECPDGQKRHLSYCIFDGKQIHGPYRVG